MIGTGTTITIGGFTALVRELDVSCSRTSIDTTYQTDTGQSGDVQWKTKVPGFADAGETSMEILFDGTQTIPFDDPESITITWPDGNTFVCDGFVSKWAPKAPLDELCTAAITITWTGKPSAMP